MRFHRSAPAPDSPSQYPHAPPSAGCPALHCTKQSVGAVPAASRNPSTAARAAKRYFFIRCLLPESENASLQRLDASPRGRLASRSQRAVRTLSKKCYGANARRTRVASNSRPGRAGRAGDARRPFGGGRAGFRADLVAGGTGSRDRAEADVVLDAAAGKVGRVDLPNAFVGRRCEAEGCIHYSTHGDVDLAVIVTRAGSTPAILGGRGRRNRGAPAVDQQHERCHGHECNKTRPASRR